MSNTIVDTGSGERTLLLAYLRDFLRRKIKREIWLGIFYGIENAVRKTDSATIREVINTVEKDPPIIVLETGGRICGLTYCLEIGDTIKVSKQTITLREQLTRIAEALIKTGEAVSKHTTALEKLYEKLHEITDDFWSKFWAGEVKISVSGNVYEVSTEKHGALRVAGIPTSLEREIVFEINVKTGEVFLTNGERVKIDIGENHFYIGEPREEKEWVNMKPFSGDDEKVFNILHKTVRLLYSLGRVLGKIEYNKAVYEKVLRDIEKPEISWRFHEEIVSPEFMEKLINTRIEIKTPEEFTVKIRYDDLLDDINEAEVNLGETTVVFMENREWRSVLTPITVFESK